MSDDQRTWGGRYQELGLLGRGGQGRVIQAWDTAQRRVVAVKLRRVDEADRVSVLQEARVLLGLRPHPNVAVVRADFFDGPEHGLVMDFVEGHPLAADESRTVGEVVDIVDQLASALDHLHGHQPPVVHGDVKPSNAVIQRGSGAVVLVDFGSARDQPSWTDAMRTQGYAAPDATSSPATDIYGLAATAFALLTGAPPGPGAGHDLDPSIRAVVAQGLSLRPDQRHPSAGAFANALREAAGIAVAPPVAGGRTIWLPRAVAVGAVALAALLAAALLNNGQAPREAGTFGDQGTTTTTPSSSVATDPPSPATTRAPVGAASSPAPTVPQRARPVVRVALVRNATVEVRDLDDAGGTNALHRQVVGESDWTSVARIFDNQLFFYSQANGDNRLVGFEPDGHVVVGRTNPAVPSSFDHVVGLGDGLVFFHRSSDGLAASHRYSDQLRLRDGDNYPNVPALAGYTHITPVGPAQVLAYRSSSGDARVLRIDASGALSIGPVRSLPAEWRVVAPGPAGVVVGVGANGVAHAVAILDDRIEVTGTAEIGGTWTDGTGARDVALLHNRASGAGVVVAVSAGRPRVVARYATPAEHSPAAVS